MRKKGPQPRITSTTELAKHLGLSRWTVSRVLNHHPDVSEKTRKQVEEAIKDLGFRPNLLGRGLRGSSTGIVGVSFQEMESPIRAKKVSVLQHLMRECGLRAVMEISSGDPEQEATILDDFLALHVDGIILFGSLLTKTHPVWKRIDEAQPKLLSIDPIAEIGGAMLQLDRSTVMGELLKHLHGLGHRKFALLGMGHDPLYGPPRLKGLREASLELGMRFEEHFQIHDIPESLDLSYEAGARLAKKILQTAKPYPTAIITLNDCHAIGAMHLLKERGYRIPEDFSIAGFDDIAVSAWTDPPLTTVSQRPEKFMQAVVDAYHRSGSHQETVQPAVRFKARFVERASTGPRQG